MSGFTAVTAALAVGTLGQLAYGADNNLLSRSYVLQNAATVKPGYAVVYDAVNDSAMLPSGASQAFLGIAFDDGTLPIEVTSYEAAVYPNMPVLKRGSVWVKISQDVDPSKDVCFQHTDNGGAKNPGVLRADVDGGNATLLGTTGKPGTGGAKWAGVFTAASGYGLLDLNQA